MDDTERSEILFAQVDLLLEHGQLEAARDLLRRLRALHAARPGAGPPPLPADQRSRIQAPLADALREQRGIARDVKQRLPGSRSGEQRAESSREEAAAATALAERQDRLLRSLPASSVSAGAHPQLNALAGSIARARDAMTAARELLAHGSFEPAAERAHAAFEALAAALHALDRVLGPRLPAPRGAGTFLHRWVEGQLPDWDLCENLARRIHEVVADRQLPTPLHRELISVVGRLSSRDAPAVPVQILKAEDDASKITVDIPLWMDVRGEGQRILVRLQFLHDSARGLQPVPSRVPNVAPTYGGRVEPLLQGEMEDCSLMVARLFDQGAGNPVDYVDPEEGLPIRDLLELRLAQHWQRGEAQPPPGRTEVLAWLDALLLEDDERPVPEDELRRLGIPAYDVADLVDRLRPIHEKLVMELATPRAQEDDGAPALAWIDAERHSFFHVHWGRDGRTPTIVLPESLLRWLEWATARSKKGEEAGFSEVLAAVQLNLGWKLLFFDRLDPDVVHGPAHRAARALERHFLAMRGLPGGSVRDLFTRLAMQYAADTGAGGQRGRGAWAQWRRAASSLFDARAGEDLLKESRLPPSAFFGPLRRVLAGSLLQQGNLAAARAAESLGGFRDAAVLFGNLVVEPATGEGVLLVGDSRIGKSSVAARLVSWTASKEKAPWRFGASDRVLALVPRPGEEGAEIPAVQVMASPAHRRFAQWTQELWFRDAQQREVRPPDHVVMRDLVPLRSVVWLHRDGGEQRSAGLRATTVADLVQDFQSRFGFTANRRFWNDFFGSVALLDLPLRRRGSDTFFEIAEEIRAGVEQAPSQRGLGAEPMWTVEMASVWFGLSADRGRLRITRVGDDAQDLEYYLYPDGSSAAQPAQLGTRTRLRGPHDHDLAALATLIPLEMSKIEQYQGLALYRAGPQRSMPLVEEYLRNTLQGPAFLVPELPEKVRQVAMELMHADDPRRWAPWLEPRRRPARAQ